MAIVWWEVETPDSEAFQQFHSAMWGWTFDRAFADSELDADYWIITSGGSGIGGLQRAQPDSQPNAGVRLYVEVHDLEQSMRRAVTRGAVIERSRTALGAEDRWFGTVMDPSGVSFGLWTSQPAHSASRNPPS